MISLARTPLEQSVFAADAQKALASPQSKMMAARGLIPVARPRDLLALLYQLSIDPDEKIAGAATGSARALPDPVLRGGLADSQLDARVLDLFAALLTAAPAARELIIGNPATADETMAAIAARGSAAEVDLIATNEQRLLRAPAIIGALYMNPKTRMSTVDRAVELAVRNDVRVPGLAAWDEIARSLDQGPAMPADDAKFAKVIATYGDDSEFTIGDPEAVEPGEESEAAIERARKKAEELHKDIPFREQKMSVKIRIATLGNAFQRAEAIRDPIKMVAVAAIKSPGMTEIEAARYAGAQSLPEEVIRHIASRRDWTRLYSIKLSLAMNPKCSIPDASRILPYLREKDLAKVAKSKGVSSAVVAQARKLIAQRGGGNKK